MSEPDTSIPMPPFVDGAYVEKLHEQVKGYENLLETLIPVQEAADNLINLLNIEAESGLPILIWNHEDFSFSECEAVRHALISLSAALDGSEPPTLALPETVN